MSRRTSNRIRAVKDALTTCRLHALLEYNPATGIFVWKVHAAHALPGDQAGSIYSGRYIVIGVDGRRYLAHRLAWFYVYGTWPKHQIDHINRSKTDNSIANLRDVSGSLNQLNQGDDSAVNKFGKMGVSAAKDRFRARIQVGGRSVSLGGYSTAQQASDAVHAGREKYHREAMTETQDAMLKARQA